MDLSSTGQNQGLKDNKYTEFVDILFRHCQGTPFIFFIRFATLYIRKLDMPVIIAIKWRFQFLDGCYIHAYDFRLHKLKVMLLGNSIKCFVANSYSK